MKLPIATCFVGLAALPLPALPRPFAAERAAHAAEPAARSIYACVFTAGGWNRADWVRVKNPMGEYFGDWVQQADCIANDVPGAVNPGEFLGKLAATYSSMVYKERIAGNFAVTSTMTFTYK